MVVQNHWKPSVGLAQFEEMINRMQVEGKSHKTITNYSFAVCKFLDYCKVEPKMLEQSHLDAYFLDLRENRKYNSNSMTPAIWGVKYFMVNVMGVEGLKYPKRKLKQTPIDILTIHEVRSMYWGCGDLRNRAIMMTLYFAQLRAFEVCNLKLSDINFNTMTIDIKSGKGDQDATIILHPELKQAIKDYIPVRHEPSNGNDTLFTTKNGTVMVPNYLYSIVKKAAKKVKIKKRVFTHLFRHSSISHRADEGMDIIRLQEQSRHKNINCLNRYIHRSIEARRRDYLNSMPSIMSVDSDEEVED